MIPVPTLGDIETVATIVGENSSRTPTPLAATGQVALNIYTFDSRPLDVSIEAAQDMVGFAQPDDMGRKRVCITSGSRHRARQRVR